MTTPSQYRKDWHQTYIKHILPFSHIVRFMTCNEPDTISPQCRIMRFESYKNGSTEEIQSKMRFNRTNEQWLRQQINWLLPMTIHITGLLGLHLEPGSSNNSHNNKREREETQTTTRQYVLPIYETRHRDFVHFISLCKELVFDLDVHDFDRFCSCTETKRKILCDTCWLHIEGAYFIMEFCLVHLFGYSKENLLYVYSGGKGIHCFVNDRRALSLSEKQRFFMYDTIAVGSGKNQDEAADNDLCKWIHRYATPQLTEKLEDLFIKQVITKRNLFVTSKSFCKWFLDKLLSHYPSTHANLIKTTVWQQMKSSASVWDIIKTLEIYDFHSKTLVKPRIFIIYRLYYPIIDKNPLANSHSIKLPFSIHTTTRNIALPIDQSFIESLDKGEQLVTLESICSAHIKRQPYPLLFSKGVTLTDEWLNMFHK